MHRIGFWLGVVAVLLGLAMVAQGIAAGQAFPSGGVLAFAVGLVLIAVSRKGGGGSAPGT